jgi:hypothetical protein
MDAAGESVTAKWQDIAKSASASAVVLYALGLVAVNVYLAQFGVTDFSLLKAQFVYTGVLLTVPLAVSALSLAAVDWAIPSDRGKAAPSAGPKEPPAGTSGAPATSRPPLKETLRTWAPHVRRGAVVVALSYALTLLVFASVFWWLLDQGLGPSIGHAATLDEFATIFILAGAAGARLWPARKPLKGEGSKAGRVAILVLALGLTLTFNRYLDRFSDDVYPNVPRQLGGGRPFSEQLVVSPESADTIHHLGLNPDPVEPNLSEAVKILFEGTQTILVCLPHSRDHQMKDPPKYVPCPSNNVVLVNKSLIEGLVLPPAHQT